MKSKEFNMQSIQFSTLDDLFFLFGFKYIPFCINIGMYGVISS